MQIRHDKCSTFGMLKKDGIYCQIFPNLSIEKSSIPCTAGGGVFRYLGRLFSFSMDNAEVKSQTVEKLKHLLITTSNLKVSALLKLKILATYIHSQLLFKLKTYELPITWMPYALITSGPGWSFR